MVDKFSIGFLLLYNHEIGEDFLFKLYLHQVSIILIKKIFKQEVRKGRRGAKEVTVNQEQFYNMVNTHLIYSIFCLSIAYIS